MDNKIPRWDKPHVAPFCLGSIIAKLTLNVWSQWEMREQSCCHSPLAILKLYLPWDHPILLYNRHQTINDKLRLINCPSGQCPEEICATCKHERSCAQPATKFSV